MVNTNMIKLNDKSSATYNKKKNALICFASGTHIMTEPGDRMVQSPEPGDKVITRDHGMQEIRWIGSRTVPAIG